jgi:type IV pilus assembly protein PilC
MTFVVPTFTKMFKDAGVELPWATQILVMVSDVFAKFWILMIGVIIAAMFIFNKWVNTDNGRKSFDKFILNVPILGGFIRKVAVARFTRTMATLLDSGVPILQAFDIVSDVVGNTTMSKALQEAKGSIREGNTIARPLAESGQFPLMVTQMIEIGEESGAITAMLEKIADFNDREVDEAVEALMAALQPMIIVFLAAIIGSIVVALFMPIFAISDIAGE